VSDTELSSAILMVCMLKKSCMAQMANSAEVLNELLGHPPSAPAPIAYNFLVPNLKGLQNFLNTSEDGNPHRTSPEKSGELPTPPPSPRPERGETGEQGPITSTEDPNEIRVRGYVSVALGCPYEGPDVPPSKVADITGTLLEMGVDEVSVADTTGMGTAPKTQELLKALFAAGISSHDLALHLHDTYGQALVNAVVGLENGIRTFDSSVGGLGGCPYSKGATGNIATEDLLHCLHSLGGKTGVDVDQMAEIGAWISKELGRPNESRAGKAILARLSS